MANVLYLKDMFYTTTAAEVWVDTDTADVAINIYYADQFGNHNSAVILLNKKSAKKLRKFLKKNGF